jgi:hypothetical protein
MHMAMVTGVVRVEFIEKSIAVEIREMDEWRSI